MKIVKLIGGLGNQLFQYAFARALGEKSQDKVLLDASWYSNSYNSIHPRPLLLSLYNITLPIATNERMLYYQKIYRRTPKIVRKFLYQSLVETEDRYTEFDETFFRKTKIYATYRGYFQNLDYFKNLLKTLQQELTLTIPLDSPNTRLLKQIKSTNAVSLHIRAGDYCINGFKLLPMEYYKQAINYIKTKLADPVFYLFSDDYGYLEKNIQNLGIQRFQIVKNAQEKGYCDLELMRACKANIIANSTFSLWGGVLNENADKIIIAPKTWIHNQRDYMGLPESWIKI